MVFIGETFCGKTRLRDCSKVPKRRKLLLEFRHVWVYNSHIPGELSAYQPQIYELLNGSFEDVVRDFEKMSSISMDYAIMESQTRWCYPHGALVGVM